MKFPLVTGKTPHFPKKARCPVCRKNKIWEPHSMAVLSAGALKMNRARTEGGPSDDLDAFLMLLWHGAHDGGEGKDREIGTLVDVVHDVRGGQADLYFCSTQCMRKFLNQCVDELERRIKKEKRSSNQRLEATGETPAPQP